MCGRFSQTRNRVSISEFEDEFSEIRLEPRFNIAPSQNSPVIVMVEGGLALEQMRFGLVPFWAKDAKVGYKMINARAETVATKPSYRGPFKRKRCLVLTDGYYEWKKEPDGSKRPFRFVMSGGEQFALGGLWDSWKDPDGEEVYSFSIITTKPNRLAEKVHDRMPIVMCPDRYRRWIDPEFQDVDELGKWLEPYPEEQMDLYEVSTLVNSTKNERAECVDPVNSA